MVIPLLSWGQFEVNGIVKSKVDNEPIPGVTIVEKGTENGTQSDLDGQFSIKVSKPNAILIFSFIGMVIKEYPLKGEKNILVETKWDCNKDFFDANSIRIYGQSGLINNTFGGQIEIASPYILSGGVLDVSYSYQTNSKMNTFHRGSLEFKHPISNCDFDIDFRISYRDFKYENQFDNEAYSFEIDFNLSRISLIAGYTNLDLNDLTASINQNSSGVLIGFGTEFGKPLFPELVGKISIFNDHIEYQGRIQGSYKRFLIFVKYYRLSSFNELSVGIGYSLSY